MTDIPGGSIIAQSSFDIAPVKLPPAHLVIGPVSISLDDGSIEYGDGYNPDEAARTFWEAMSKAYGGPEAVFGYGLAARVDAEMAGLRERADTAEAQVARIRAFLEDMAGWCSPHGVAADYSRRGLDALDGVDPLGLAGPTREQPAEELSELSREDALELVDELGQQAYRAEDRLAFVREMCDLADREQRQITTEQVRAWSSYSGCGGAIVLPEDIQERLKAELAEPDPIEISSYDRGPGQGQAWVWRCSGIRHCPGGFMGLDLDTETAARTEADRHSRENHGTEPTERQLHRRMACPGWEYATTEGPRKQWDDADRPPEGDGWERNVDAGRDGWERFDYTEESYWRRRAVSGPA